jgi:hypothetical protein
MGDGLYERLRKIAEQERTTMRCLVEEGLHSVLPKHERHEKYVFTPVTFKGNGLTEEFRAAEWGAVRQATYEGRGS